MNGIRIAVAVAFALAVSLTAQAQEGHAQMPVVEQCTPTLDHPRCSETWIAPAPLQVSNNLILHIDPEPTMKPMTGQPVHAYGTSFVKQPFALCGRIGIKVAYASDKILTAACSIELGCDDSHKQIAGNGKLLRVK